MSEEAESQLKRASLRNKLSAILSCLLFLLLGGAILAFAVIYIAKPQQASFVSYKPKKKANAKTTRKQVSEENAVQEEASASEPTTPMLVSNSPNAVPMPIAATAMDMGEGISADAGLGDGLGAGDLGDSLGGGGDGLGSKDGGGSTLEGTFYDLKKKKSGASSGLNGTQADRDNVIAALSKFFASWNAAELNKYYKSETKLYASSWYLPTAHAKYGPIAYEVGDPKKPESTWECQPAAWIVVYRGKVIAPKTGKFRFIGTGDDVLAVRFNRRTVLEGGWCAPSAYDKNNKGASHLENRASREAFLKKHHFEMINTVTGCDKWNNELGGLIAGSEFSVREGEEYPIEIAISEIPGGAFGFVLFIEDVTEGKNSRAKQYDLFRTCDTNPDIQKVLKSLRETGCIWPGSSEIPFNEDSWVWESVPMD